METHADHPSDSTIACARRLSDAPIVVLCGHYGVGKTEITLNLASVLASDGRAVTIVDLDVVNPYFRSSDVRDRLADLGIDLVAPNFADTALDTPSLSGRIDAVISQADREHPLIIDAGGDDVGATVLARYAPAIARRGYLMHYVVNAFRDTADDVDAQIEILRGVSAASGLTVDDVVSNAHLMTETDRSHIVDGACFARRFAEAAGVPVAAFTVYADAVGGCDADAVAADISDALKRSVGADEVLPVRRFMQNRWE